MGPCPSVIVKFFRICCDFKEWVSSVIITSNKNYTYRLSQEAQRTAEDSRLICTKGLIADGPPDAIHSYLQSALAHCLSVGQSHLDRLLKTDAPVSGLAQHS